MGERGQEKVVRRWEKEDWRKKTGERRQEKEDGRKKTGDRR